MIDQRLGFFSHSCAQLSFKVIEYKPCGELNNSYFNKITAFCEFIHCTEVQFSSFFSCGFITAIVVNPPERKLAKCTSVQCVELELRWQFCMHGSICPEIYL